MKCISNLTKKQNNMKRQGSQEAMEVMLTALFQKFLNRSTFKWNEDKATIHLQN